MRLPVGLLAIAVSGLVVCTGAGFLGGLWWGFDLAASFRMHYLVVAAVAAGVAAGLEMWRIAAAGWLALAINLAVVAPLYLPGGPTAGDGPRLHVVAFNVHGGNPNLDAIADYLADEDPDVVIVTELEPALADVLDARLDGYHLASRPQRDNFGIGILTREPLRGSVILTDDLPGYPAAGARVPLGDGAVQVLGIHPPPPVGRHFATVRDDLLARAGARARDAADPVILCGDFNATHWSYPMRQLRSLGLHDAARGRGVLATWPQPLGALGIPIDHCLHSGELAVVERRVGPWLGSDHRPLHVVFARSR